MKQDPRFRATTHESTLLSQDLEALVEKMGPRKNKDLLLQLLNAAVNFADAEIDRLDLKIASSALAELHGAFATFHPYRSIKKLTVFGSARTPADHPDYQVTVKLARAMAQQGWMIITGAGPGIMAAGIEGAGRENSFGVNIKLPFEQTANLFIQQDPKLVEMKYFFTRKLIFTKESDGFLILPGGFGTMDEAFELLTLMQTGKAEPAPVVFFHSEGSQYWHDWEAYIKERLFEGGYVSPEDESLYLITSDIDRAITEFCGFYRNYHSMRWVGNLLILRMRVAPTSEELAKINARYFDICQSGTIEAIPITGAEKGERDGLDLCRLALRFDHLSHGRLRQLINELNTLSSVGEIQPI